jgi:hypothetical protein
MGAHEPPTDHPSGRDAAAGGSFINVRHDDPDGPERLAQYHADLRARVGDEVFERIQRSQALDENPRPLSGREKAVLREAVAPVLRDLEATGQTLPDIREEAHEDRGEDAVCAWIPHPGGGGGESISVELYCGEAYRLFYLAEQLQSWKNDELIDARRRPWPECPDHPGPCTLSPDVRDEVAVWCCPDSGRVIAAIGTLAQPQT